MASRGLAAASPRPFRVGIVGAGFGREIILPALRRVDGAQVAALATSRPEGASGSGSDAGEATVFPRWTDLVASPDVDAVVVATPPASHPAICAAALDHGKAVLCEKPLAASLADARRLASAAARAGAPAAVDFEFREMAAMRTLRERLERGALGAVRSVRVDWRSGSWADPRRAWSWRVDRTLGGGVLSAFGCHAFDYLRWLLGPPRRVHARLATRVGERPAEGGGLRPVTAEDEAEVRVEFSGQATAVVSLSQVAVGPLAHRIEVEAEEATFIIAREAWQGSHRFGAWEGRRPGERPQPVALPPDAAPGDGDERIPLVADLLRRFRATALGDADGALPSFEDGLWAQRVMEAAIQSDRERAWVDIGDIQS